MIPMRAIGWFFAKVIAFYLIGVMAWNWAGADRPYLYVFRETHTQLFRTLHRMGSPWVVVLAQPEKAAGTFDTDLNVLNTTNKTIGTQPLKGQYRAFAPTLLLCSLVLATPVTWARRGIALFIGCIVLQMWIALGIFLLVLKAYVTPGELMLYAWGDTSRSVLNFITEVISTSTATQFAVPVLVWVLVTFRASDAAKLLGIHAVIEETASLPAAEPPVKKRRGRRR